MSGSETEIKTEKQKRVRLKISRRQFIILAFIVLILAGATGIYYLQSRTPVPSLNPKEISKVLGDYTGKIQVSTQIMARAKSANKSVPEYLSGSDKILVIAICDTNSRDQIIADLGSEAIAHSMRKMGSNANMFGVEVTAKGLQIISADKRVTELTIQSATSKPK